MSPGLKQGPSSITSASSPQAGLGPPPSRPLTKKRPHRRSPQACDECRLRKRACDAVEPCRPCQRAGLKCTYQFRRPVPPPTLRIRDLQDHLSLAHKWLQHVKDNVPSGSLPGLDIDECLRTLDFTQPHPNEAASPVNTMETPNATNTTAPTPTKSNRSTPILSPATAGLDLPTGGIASSERQSMGNMLAGYDRTLTLPSGETCYYGAFSDLSFALRIIELFRQGPAPGGHAEFNSIRGAFTKPTQRSPEAAPSVSPFPDQIMNSHVASPAAQHLMLSFVSHQRQGESVIEPPLSDDALRRISLALQELTDFRQHQTLGCETVTNQANSQIHQGLAALLPIDHDTLASLQALLCAASFMLTSGHMNAAHSLISTASSLARRIGLFVKATTSAESPRRVEHLQALATLMTLDLLTSLILDIPPAVRTDVVNDRYLSETAQEFESQNDMRTAAMLRQVCLLLVPRSIRDRTRRAATSPEKESDAVMEDIRLLETAHAGFRRWKRDISSLLTSLGPTDEEKVIGKDLEMIYNFCQIIVFRSHLHHLRSVAVGGSMSKAQSYHALACLKIATSTIGHIDRPNDTAQLSTLANSWLGVYTIFSAVMCLVFLIAAHPGTARPSVAWQRAHKGIRILAACSCGDNIAAACLEVVKIVTMELSHTVYFDYAEIEASVRRVCDGEGLNDGTPARSSPSMSTFGMEAAFMDNPADRMLFQADTLTAEFDFRDILHFSESE